MKAWADPRLRAKASRRRDVTTRRRPALDEAPEMPTRPANRRDRDGDVRNPAQVVRQTTSARELGGARRTGPRRPDAEALPDD